MTTKIKAGVIAAGAVDASALSDNSITIAHLNCSDGTNGQVLSTDGSGTLSFADGGVDGIVSSADATAITIDSSENVGIGTTSPLDALHIVSAVSSDYRGNLFLDDSTTGFAAGVGGQITFGAEYRSNGDHTEWAAIQGAKANSTDANYAGTLEFKTRANGGAMQTKMILDDSGNVGIGTSSPDSTFEVATNDASGNRMGIVGDGATTGSALWTNWTTGNSYLDFRLGGTTSTYTKMRIDSSGNVGIGSTNPSYNLDIWGATDPAVRVYNTGTGSSDDSLLRLQIGGSTARNFIYFGDTDDSDIGKIEYNHSDNSMRITTNTAEAFRVHSSGAISVGSDEVYGLLNVEGSINFNGNIRPNANTDGGSESAPTICVGYDNDTGFFHPTSNTIGFTTLGSERMRIDSSGRVGIGAAPQTAPYYNNDDPVLTVHKASGNAILPIVAAANTSSAILHLNQSGNRYWRISAINADAALTFGGKQPGSGAGETENVRISTKGLSLGDTDGDYVSRNNTGGLHVKRGGILMNGPPGDANMSGGTNGNQWTYLGQGGRGGSFTSLTISVPNPNNGASGVGYGGFSLEFYIAGYNAKYHSGHFSGYVNGGITLSKRAFWDSSGSGTLSSGSVGAQGFYLTIGFPSMTHPTCKFVINKGGHGSSAGNAAWTNMSGVSITWA